MTKKKLTRSKLVKKLDTIFSRWVRLSNADDNGNCICITCKKQSHWKSIQAGHFRSRKHYATRWAEDNVFPQCLACNVFRGGEQYLYSLQLGQQLSNDLLKRSLETVKLADVELLEMIDYYQEEVKKYL